MARRPARRASKLAIQPLSLCHKYGRTLPGFIPQGQLDPVPETQFVINGAQVVLDNVLGGADGLGYLAILHALGNKLDDSVFAFAWDTAAIAVIC